MPYYKVKNGVGIQEIAGLDKTLESLRARYTDMQEREEYAIEMRKKAEKELDELKAKRKEKVRDEYIEQLEADLAREREERQHSFIISNEKWNEMRKWQEKHIMEKHYYIDETGEKQPKLAGMIGGRFSYTFVPTSIGIFGKCKCACGEEFDISDEM